VPIPENCGKSLLEVPGGGISRPSVGADSQASAGNIHRIRRVESQTPGEECVIMIGKLFGAWLGEKVAGENEGAKGAILGYGAASLAKRSVPTLAALALGGWAWRRWRNKRRADAAYPSEATPSSPSGA
jgi:hypothetical protein